MDTKTIDKQAIRLHHVSAHFTNGLYPTSLLFLLMAFFFDPSYEVTAFYLFLIATLASPFTYLSGVVDWVIRFKKARTPIFNKKIYYGIALIVLSLIVIVWRLSMGNTMFENMALAQVYLLLNIIITAIVLYLGYLGGKFLLR